MSAKNSGTLDNQWTILSVVESEYSGLIFPVEPIPPVEPISPVEPIRLLKSILSEDSISPEAFSFPEDPISAEARIHPRDPGPRDPGPRDPGPRDPLTGNSTVNTTPSTVTRLSNPEFRILIDTTRPNEYKVEGKVTVEISEEDMEIFSIFTMRLQSTLWGEDSGPNKEDELFSFPATRLKLPGTYTFSAYVHRGTLNEDNTIFDKRDEVYNKFSIVSGNRFLQSPGIEIQSRTEHGYFG